MTVYHAEVTAREGMAREGMAREGMARPFEWRGPVLGAVAAAIVGLVVAWGGRPTPESAQAASSIAAVQAATSTQVTAMTATLGQLAAKIDAINERVYSAYTRADAAADRAEAARRSDAIDARLTRLEQTVYDLQRRGGQALPRPAQ